MAFFHTAKWNVLVGEYISGRVHTITGVWCVTQLAAQLHSAAELRHAIGHLPHQRNCSRCLIVCCCVAWVQKTIQAIMICQLCAFILILIQQNTYVTQAWYHGFLLLSHHLPIFFQIPPPLPSDTHPHVWTRAFSPPPLQKKMWKKLNNFDKIKISGLKTTLESFVLCLKYQKWVKFCPRELLWLYGIFQVSPERSPKCCPSPMKNLEKKTWIFCTRFDFDDKYSYILLVIPLEFIKIWSWQDLVNSVNRFFPETLVLIFFIYSKKNESSTWVGEGFSSEF